MRFLLKLIFLFACLVGSASLSLAKDAETLESVLDRAASQQRAVIDYREVRHMQLLSLSWQAQGRIYLSGSSFVIDQHSPQKQLLVAEGTRIWLFNPKRKIRRSMMLSAPTAQKSLSFIMPIIRGERETLERHFHINFSYKLENWRIEFKPKQATDFHYSRIVLSGPRGEAARMMRTEMHDGDYSEWFFSQKPFTDETLEQIDLLIKETKGM
jgi:outer membrane lipoprotein-sorting protein